MLRKKINLKSEKIFPGKHFLKNCLLKLQSKKKKKATITYYLQNYILSKHFIKTYEKAY